VAPDRGHYFSSGHWRGTGGGRPGLKGREVYGRREKRGQEARFLRWREAGEKGEDYAKSCKISQSKKKAKVGANKYRPRNKPSCSRFPYKSLGEPDFRKEKVIYQVFYGQNV